MRASRWSTLAVAALAFLTSCTPPPKGTKDVRFGKLHTLTIGTTTQTYEYDTIGRISRITKTDGGTVVAIRSYAWSSPSPPTTVIETLTTQTPYSTTTSTWKLNSSGLAVEMDSDKGVTTYTYDPGAEHWKLATDPQGNTDTRTIVNGDIFQEVQADKNGNPIGVGTNVIHPDPSAPNYDDGRRFQGVLYLHMLKDETRSMGDSYTYTYMLYPDGKVKEQDKVGPTTQVTIFTYYPN